MGRYVSFIPDESINGFLKALNSKGQKYEMLARFGIETGLRVSDILGLKLGQIKKDMAVMQSKTKTIKHCCPSDGLLQSIRAYAKRYGLSKNDYFIPSTQNTKNKPLSRIQAYRAFKDVSAEMGLPEIGTHSMRKTYARQLYRESNNMAVVQRELGHKYVETTLRYFMDITKLISH